MAVRITRIFFDVSLINGFPGLAALAKKEKAANTEDTTLLFINRKMTAFKMLRSKDYLIYYKNGNKRIPLDSLKFLPKYFGGSELEMAQAIKQSLTEKLHLAD